MNEKSHKIIAVFCAISLIVSGFAFSVNSTVEEQSNLSADLLSRLEIVSEEAEIPVAVWTYDENEIVDKRVQMLILLKQVFMNQLHQRKRMNYQS